MGALECPQWCTGRAVIEGALVAQNQNIAAELQSSGLPRVTIDTMASLACESVCLQIQEAGRAVDGCGGRAFGLNGQPAVSANGGEK